MPCKCLFFSAIISFFGGREAVQQSLEQFEEESGRRPANDCTCIMSLFLKQILNIDYSKKEIKKDRKVESILLERPLFLFSWYEVCDYLTDYNK